MPVRVQRQRAKGWRMPENTVYVGRPSKWGNPSPPDPDWWESGAMSREAAFALSVSDFRELVENELDFAGEIRRELRGKNLACWCPLDQSCHADVLLEIANG